MGGRGAFNQKLKFTEEAHFQFNFFEITDLFFCHPM